MRRIAAILAGLLCLVIGAAWLRTTLGIELSTESIREQIEASGSFAIAIFIGLMTIRHFALLPSTLMLTLSGALWGVAVGGLVGAAGMLANALFEFAIFRGLTPAWLASRMGSPDTSARQLAIERGTPALLLLTTAVPSMPVTLFIWAAAFTPMSTGRFALTVSAGALVRGYTLAMLGAGIFSADSRMTMIGACAIVALMLLAAMSPELRSSLRR